MITLLAVFLLLDLGQAERSFEMAQTQAKSEMISAFDKAIENAKDTRGVAGDKKIAWIKKLTEDKERFDSNGYLSATKDLRPATLKFKANLEQAKTEMVKAYDAEIDKLIREKKLGDAEKVGSKRAELAKRELFAYPPDEIIGTYARKVGNGEDRYEVSFDQGTWSIEYLYTVRNQIKGKVIWAPEFKDRQLVGNSSIKQKAFPDWFETSDQFRREGNELVRVLKNRTNDSTGEVRYQKITR
jgi:cellobiose-specific phosphotransferase system component IIA